MGITYAGQLVLSPNEIVSANLRDGLPIVPQVGEDSWFGQANSYSCSVGMEPSKGVVLLTQAQLAQINLNQGNALTFNDGDRSFTFPNVIVRRYQCIRPGASGDPNNPYAVWITDRRWVLQNIPIDQGYNVYTDGTASAYQSLTTNSGTAWNWLTMFQNIWGQCSGLGTAPSLPFTPDGSPSGFQFYGSTVWAALGIVLNRLCCALRYNPLTDKFSIVQLGASDIVAQNVMNALTSQRVWDEYLGEPAYARLPQYVRVLFYKYPAPTDGSSIYYSINVADTNPLPGALAGTVVNITDDEPAIYSGSTLTNSSALTSRAAQRAADWFRRRKVFTLPLHRQYANFQNSCITAVGSTVFEFAILDTGTGLKTEIISGPDIPPAAVGLAPPVTAGSSGGSITTEYTDASLVIDPTTILGIYPNVGLILTNPSAAFAQLSLSQQIQYINSLTTTQAQNINYTYSNLTYTQIQNLVYQYQNLTYTQIQNLVYLFQSLTYAQFQTLVYFFANITLTNTQINNLFYVFLNLTYAQLQNFVYWFVNVTLTNVQVTNLNYFFANLTYAQLVVLIGYATGSTSSLAGDVTGAFGANSVVKLKGISLDTTAASPGDADILIYRSSTNKWVPNPLSEDVEMTDTGGCTVVAIQGTAVSSAAPTDAQVFIYNSAQWVPRSLSQDVTITDTGVVTVKGLQSKPVSSTAPTTNQILQWNGTAWTPTTYIAWPCTTAGDLPYENATPAAARLPIGSNGQILTVVSGLPSWQTAAIGPVPTGAPTITATPGNAQNTIGITLGSGSTNTYVYRSTSSTPTYLTGTLIYSGTGVSYVDTGLTNGTTYYYIAYSWNAGILYSPPSSVVYATPSTGATYTTYTASGTYTPIANSSTVQVLLVAGGGGARCSGGGAGGCLYHSSVTVVSGTGYTITVGAGGTGASGGNSSGLGFTASGGGYGNNAQAGGSGGSGGGGGVYPGGGTGYSGGAGTTGQGNSGGAGVWTAPYHGAGGGGGASAVGANGSGAGGGNGGAGNTFFGGAKGPFGGGGGGGCGTTGGAGGTGGTGGGANGSGTTTGTAGTANTGGGGGGVLYGHTGGSGGSGIVIIYGPASST